MYFLLQKKQTFAKDKVQKVGFQKKNILQTIN